MVSPPGRDSRNSRSSRLADATEKPLSTSALPNFSGICIWFLLTFVQLLQNRFLNHARLL